MKDRSRRVALLMTLGLLAACGAQARQTSRVGPEPPPPQPAPVASAVAAPSPPAVVQTPPSPPIDWLATAEPVKRGLRSCPRVWAAADPLAMTPYVPRMVCAPARGVTFSAPVDFTRDVVVLLSAPTPGAPIELVDAPVVVATEKDLTVVGLESPCLICGGQVSIEVMRKECLAKLRTGTAVRIPRAKNVLFLAQRRCDPRLP